MSRRPRGHVQRGHPHSSSDLHQPKDILYREIDRSPAALSKEASHVLGKNFRGIVVESEVSSQPFVLVPFEVFNRMDQMLVRMDGRIKQLTVSIDKAQAVERERKAELSHISRKLQQKTSAFREAKNNFFSQIHTVSSLQPLRSEVEQIHRKQTREMKAINQLKRLVHDIRRQRPRRRRSKTMNAMAASSSTKIKHRICYKCRCKGHIAQDCTLASIGPSQSVHLVPTVLLPEFVLPVETETPTKIESNLDHG